MKSVELTSLDLKQTGARIVEALLNDELLEPNHICEASVHRPTRSRVWVATFTSAAGGQIWRSTGLTDRAQAFLVAKKWEAQARAQRAKIGCSNRKPVLRVRHPISGPDTGQLTQLEVAMLLNISERAVRAAERSAIAKLRRHPLLREIWEKYLAGELDEDDQRLTAIEMEALYSLAQSLSERRLIDKVLHLVYIDHQFGR